MSPESPGYKEKKPRPVWERNGQDTNESWPYFKAYRDTSSGVRTLERVRFSPAEDVRRPINRSQAPTLEQMHRWHAEGQWGPRVAAFDAHMDSLQNEEREAIVRHGGAKLAAEHMAMLQVAQDLIKAELQKLLEEAKNSDFPKMKPNEITRLMTEYLKFSRLIDGKPTEKIETHFDLSGLSADELRTMRELQAKVEKEET